VLHDFARADEEWLDDLLRGIADGAVYLAEGDSARFSNAVGLRTGAATPAKKARKPEVTTKAPVDEAPDGRTSMQKLMDKFKG
jgi:PTH1 family peptidyl-tRNA hydrolase